MDVVSRYQEHVGDEFTEASKTTPAWFFLRWINQVAATLSRPESGIIKDLVARICCQYAQALYYPFKVIESNIETASIGASGSQSVSKVFVALQARYSKFELLNQWTEALDCMIFPEHRFTYWLQLVCDAQQDAPVSLGSGQVAATRALEQRVRGIVLKMLADIMSPSKPLVGEDIGLYNRQFFEKWRPIFTKAFGAGGVKVPQMDLASLLTSLEEIRKKVGAVALFHGAEQLSKYSEWLSELDCNEFNDSRNRIEIPGQYETSVFASEPLRQGNVKVASVKKMCLVLGSIRRPKKITVHGSNEKDYNLLVKGGEDLRLDQRVT